MFTVLASPSNPFSYTVLRNFNHISISDQEMIYVDFEKSGKFLLDLNIIQNMRNILFLATPVSHDSSTEILKPSEEKI